MTHSSIAIVVPKTKVPLVTAVLAAQREATAAWIPCGPLETPDTHCATHFYVNKEDADLLMGRVAHPDPQAASVLASLFVNEVSGWAMGEALQCLLGKLGYVFKNNPEED